jgi:hypothetical protein
MNWGQNTTHTVSSSAEYDRSYGNGNPVKTIVYLSIAGKENEIFNALIPQNTTILDILLQIDRNNSSSGEAILAGDEFSSYTGNYQLNIGYTFTKMNGDCLNINLDTPVEDIVTRGKNASRQAKFKIVYSVNRWCNMMGGQKSYNKYKKTYNNKKRKSRKSRKHRRK